MTTNLPQQTVKKKGLTFHDITPYFYILPSLALFILFVFYPFVKTIILSLSVTDNSGNILSWANPLFSNFATALTDSSMWFAIEMCIRDRSSASISG